MTIDKLLICFVAAAPVCLIVFMTWQCRKTEREYFDNLREDNKQWKEDTNG